MRPVAIAPIFRQGLASGEGGRVPVLTRHVDDRDPLDQARQGRCHGTVEPADGLRSAEDQQHPHPGRHAESCAGFIAVQLASVTDRRAGDVARTSWGGRFQGHTGGLERDGQHVGQTRGRPNGTTRDHVPVPQHDRDTERGRGEEDGDGHVATGREDRIRTVGREDRAGLRDRRAETQRVEQRVHAEVDGPQGTEREPAERDPGRRHDARLEPAMTTEPGELSGVRPSAQRAGDGQRRVDVPARPAAGDQHSHRRSRCPFRWSRARSRAGSRPRRS